MDYKLVLWRRTMLFIASNMSRPKSDHCSVAGLFWLDVSLKLLIVGKALISRLPNASVFEFGFRLLSRNQATLTGVWCLVFWPIDLYDLLWSYLYHWWSLVLIWGLTVAKSGFFDRSYLMATKTAVFCCCVVFAEVATTWEVYGRQTLEGVL